MLAMLEQVPSPYTREEHWLNEQSLVRNGDNKRVPRRSHTHHDYCIPQPPVFTLQTIHSPPPSPGFSQDSRQTSTVTSPSEEHNRQLQLQQQPPHPVAAPRRPPLGPPRRSYSVTDKEPLPHHHRPGGRLQLMDLPPEIHYAIFDFLDPIDSTCLGLTNSNLYSIHRRLHGTVPLAVHRAGPNELEWAWHLAGQHVAAKPSLLTQKNEPGPKEGLDPEERKALICLRVRGQALCRKCVVSRCQLQTHIKDWMGEKYEYCDITQKFGPKAEEGARKKCERSSPRHSNWCARHGKKKGAAVKKQQQEATGQILGTV
ncbi:uncharacterized protein PODANS_4_2790 [Podospora anserina S mat+]|uniref:Podospora anserina S mat+ genomic DNA chromosome 4, supercontig 2 n=1 Tax=Podospora anserina (strain S / ATCC MYA-4624 / DSM 980 / FGSC 10383) TaxID=515849 RepID=B2AE43_PODAN|nr:uncharacterized protein PODANS_4_2790 [Podospora anserina S mat+]CAP61709.1 unnamed protein product [Podospora anserina S mat+]CDP28057.1 Putative protein of unknown function [Podospora anserina S mat+]